MTKIEKILYEGCGKLTGKLMVYGKKKKMPVIIVKFVENTDFDCKLYFNAGQAIVRFDIKNFPQLLSVTRKNKIEELIISIVQYTYWKSQADNAERAFLKKLQNRG